MTIKLLTTNEVAQRLRISKLHLRALINRGIIKAFKESYKSGFRIPETEIERYILYKMSESDPSLEVNPIHTCIQKDSRYKD